MSVQSCLSPRLPAITTCFFSYPWVHLWFACQFCMISAFRSRTSAEVHQSGTGKRRRCWPPRAPQTSSAFTTCTVHTGTNAFHTNAEGEGDGNRKRTHKAPSFLDSFTCPPCCSAVHRRAFSPTVVMKPDGRESGHASQNHRPSSKCNRLIPECMLVWFLLGVFLLTVNWFFY